MAKGMNTQRLQDYGLWWAHLGSNQGPTGYEPVALPTELWALQMQAAQRHLSALVGMAPRFCDSQPQ